MSDITLTPGRDDRLMTYYYDAQGRLQAEINGKGSATSYRYDAQGHLVETIRYTNKLVNTRTGDWRLDAPVPISYKDLHTYTVYNTA
jgi:YD repeat-containing protein